MQTVNQRITAITAKLDELERVIEYATGLVKVRKANEQTSLQQQLRFYVDLRRVHGGSYILEADDGEASTTNFISFS